MASAQSTCWTLIQAAAEGERQEREEFARRDAPVIQAYLAARWRGSALQSEVDDALDDALQEAFLERYRSGGALQRMRTAWTAYPKVEYSCSMKVKTSITLSPQVLRMLDELAAPGLNRSLLIERAVIEFVERKRREKRDAKDLQILNRCAEELNQEVEDVLAFQVVP